MEWGSRHRRDSSSIPIDEKILVTGSIGNVGSSLILAHRRTGAKIGSLAHDQSKGQTEHSKRSKKSFQMDWSQSSLLQSWVDMQETIMFSLASEKTHVIHPWDKSKSHLNMGRVLQ